MKSIRYCILLSLLLWAGATMGQALPTTDDGVAVRSYWLGKNKIMASYYDRLGRLIFEWCNRPDLLAKAGSNAEDAYIRFYIYDGRKTNIITYEGKLMNEKYVVFTNMLSVNIRIANQVNGWYDGIYYLIYLNGVASRFRIENVPYRQIEYYRKMNAYFGEIPKAATDTAQFNLLFKTRKLLETLRQSPPTENRERRNEKHDKLLYEIPSGVDGPSDHKNAKMLQMKDVYGALPDSVRSYFDKEGRLYRRDENALREFTFDQEQILKIGSQHEYVYPKKTAGFIMVRKKWNWRNFRIRVENEYY